MTSSAASVKAWREKNPEKHRAWVKAYAIRTKEKRRLYQAARNRLTRGRRFGLKPGEHAEMLAAQGGVCAACKRPDGIQRRGFPVDHDHVTGQVRGILCHSCNIALGLMGESPDRLRGLITYIETWRNAH